MEGKSDKEKIEKEAAEITGTLLNLIGLTAKVVVETQDSLIKVEISGDNLGLLIGHRGTNLESFQAILGLLLHKRLGGENWHPVLADVNGWREKREEALRRLVERAAAKIASGQDFVELPPMPPAQRRTTHLLAKEHKGLKSESEGEGLSRHVVIKREEKNYNAA